MLLQAMGQLAEAETLSQEALQVRRQQLGDLHPDTLIAVNNLGMFLRAMGKLVEAEPLYQEPLKGTRQQLEDLHPDVFFFDLHQHPRNALQATGGWLEQRTSIRGL